MPETPASTPVTLEYLNPRTAPDPARPVGVLIIVAAVALSSAIQVRDGLYDPRAVAMLGVAVAACFLAIVLMPIRFLRALEIFQLPLLALSLGYQFHQLLTTRPGSEHAQLFGLIPYFEFRATLAMAAIGCALLFIPRFGKLPFLIVLVAFLIAGGWIIGEVRQPYMDVWWAQQSGLDAFVHGTNPYTATYPDIYNHSTLYAPGYIVSGRVQNGFPYPPLTFWLDLPSYLLTRDYRYSNLIAIALAGVLIAYSRPGKVPALAAALLLFTPRIFFILESGWTEPTAVLLLAAIVFVAARKKGGHSTLFAPPRTPEIKNRDESGSSLLTPILLGLLIASKQYMLFVIPAALLLIPRPWSFARIARFAVIAIISGCVVSLPLILWNVPAFIRSNFKMAAASNFRDDALSFVAHYFHRTGTVPPTWIGFAAAAIVVICAVFIFPRTPAAFAASIAMAYLLFFSFGKFAFCNYYFFVLAAICCTIATANGERPPTILKGEAPAELEVASR